MMSNTRYKNIGYSDVRDNYDLAISRIFHKTLREVHLAVRSYRTEGFSKAVLDQIRDLQSSNRPSPNISRETLDMDKDSDTRNNRCFRERYDHQLQNGRN